MNCADVPGPLDWLAFILGGIGISFTVVELARSKGALKAAKNALVATRRSLLKNQLVAVLPRFDANLKLIEEAFTLGKRDELSIHLLSLIKDSVEAIALIDSQKDDLKPALGQISLILDNAGRMRSSIYELDSSVFSDDFFTKQYFMRIQRAIPELHQYAVQLRNDPGNSLETVESEGK